MEFEEYANSLFPVLSLLPWLLAQLHIVFFSTYHQQIDAPVCRFIELGTQSTCLASFYVFLC